MKYTVLEMTQIILSSLDSDEVNSISDTVESRQVSTILRTTYFNMITRTNLPEQRTIFSLDSSGSGDLPVLMFRPDNVDTIEWIKYDKTTPGETGPIYQYVTILPISQFIDMVNRLNPTETNVGTYQFNNHTLFFQDDRHPQFCTIIGNVNVLFDSYLNTVDTTLQSSKTMCYGRLVPVFLLEDSFVPDLDEQQFPLLINEAKAVAFMELKQLPNEKAEQEARRQWRTLQKGKSTHKPTYFDCLPDFGRNLRHSTWNVFTWGGKQIVQ